MIAVEALTVRQGTFALTDIAFHIPAGQYGVLMGKTGSGKTTLLEAICGLRPIRAGRIVLNGRDVTACKPAGRGVGYVPQDRALFPTLTVRDHLAFGPAVRGWHSADIERRVEELADTLGIRHLLGRRPRGLSGGEAQRVALGRALAARPDVLLFDEPLSALDEETSQEMVDLLRTLRRQTPLTVLHVTHSNREAEQLADRLFRLEKGTIREADEPAVTPQTRRPGTG